MKLYQTINKSNIYFLLFHGARPVNVIKELFEDRTVFRFQFEVNESTKEILNKMRDVDNKKLEYDDLTKAMDIYFEIIRAKYPRGGKC